MAEDCAFALVKLEENLSRPGDDRHEVDEDDKPRFTSWADEVEFEEALLLSQGKQLMPSWEQLQLGWSKPSDELPGSTPCGQLNRRRRRSFASKPKKKRGTVKEIQATSESLDPLHSVEKKKKKKKKRKLPNYEGRKLFMGGILFADLEVMQPEELAECVCDDQREAQQGAPLENLAKRRGEGELHVLREIRVECLLGMLADFGPIEMVNPCWEARYCHVIYSEKEGAEKAFKVLNDPQERRKRIEAIKADLDQMGLPAFAAPVDNFYLRWPRSSAHLNAAAASEPIPSLQKNGVDAHELEVKEEPKMQAENHLEAWDQPNVQNEQTCEIESQPSSSSSSECTDDDHHVSKCGKDVSRQEEEKEDLACDRMAHQERQDFKGSSHDVPADPTAITSQRVAKEKDLLFPSNVEILSSLVACCLCSLFIVISYGTNGDTTSVVASLFQ